jgi:hypothetical protein
VRGWRWSVVGEGIGVMGMGMVVLMGWESGGYDGREII